MEAVLPPSQMVFLYFDDDDDDDDDDNEDEDDDDDDDDLGQYIRAREAVQPPETPKRMTKNQQRPSQWNRTWMATMILTTTMMIKADRPKSLNSRWSVVAEEEERDEDQSAQRRDEQLPG